MVFERKFGDISNIETCPFRITRKTKGLNLNAVEPSEADLQLVYSGAVLCSAGPTGRDLCDPNNPEVCRRKGQDFCDRGWATQPRRVHGSFRFKR